MMTNPERYSIPVLSRQSLIFLAIALVITVPAALTGSAITAPAIPVWYAGLNKPAFNPPNGLFGIIWPILFSLMIFGFWRILRHVGAGKARAHAILAFVVQILFNAGWSIAFFGARNPGAGVIVALGLVLAVAFMVLTFRKVDAFAALIQLPYLCWVSFALFLNITIWRLNA
ncbi:MAG: TspO/MBR family protein [Beijerinckiaceae bacterium]